MEPIRVREAHLHRNLSKARTPVVNRIVTPLDIRERRTIGFGVRPDENKIKAANAGLGADPGKAARTGLGDLIEAIKNSVQCPLYCMPVIESSRGTFGGPMLDVDITRLLGATIKPFSWNESTAGLDSFDTTLAQNGELQTPTLVCAIGWKIQPEPLCWTVQGNAWTTPEADAVQPFSPNVFTFRDLPQILGQRVDQQTFEPAVLEWGWPQNYAAWHMVRGYHLRWMIGQHTNIFDESLRNTAVMPISAQEGSASSSEVDVLEFIRRVNDRYNSQLTSGLSFLKFDTLRLGCTAAGTGLFTPSRSSELVGATYGGIGLRNLLKQNEEFRKLTVPYFLNAGIPIGLYAQESDQFQADLMREYISVTQTPGGGGGGVPPAILDAQHISSGPTSPFQERPLGGLPDVAQTVFAQRRLYKGGDLKVEVDLKGFEVDEDWYTTLKVNPELREAFMCECGCAWPK